MKKTINEVIEMYKGDYTEVEIYRYNNPSMYYNGGIHTDSIEYLDNDIDYNKTYDLDCQLMDEDDYNNTVLANAGEHFTDMYELEDKVLVIVLLDTHILDDIVYNQEEWDKLCFEGKIKL